MFSAPRDTYRGHRCKLVVCVSNLRHGVHLTEDSASPIWLYDSHVQSLHASVPARNSKRNNPVFIKEVLLKEIIIIIIIIIKRRSGINPIPPTVIDRD